MIIIKHILFSYFYMFVIQTFSIKMLLFLAPVFLVDGNRAISLFSRHYQVFSHLPLVEAVV